MKVEWLSETENVFEERMQSGEHEDGERRNGKS